MNSRERHHTIETSEAAGSGVAFTPDPVRRKEGIRKEIEAAMFHTRKGLWGLILFLCASLAAWCLSGVDLAGPMVPGMRQLIEPEQFLAMIDIVLVVSTVSDLIMIAGRLNDGGKPSRIWLHAGFRAAFYLFYLLGGLLPARFLAVFGAGVLVMGFEQAVLYLYASRTIRESRELLSAMGR